MKGDNINKNFFIKENLRPRAAKYSLARRAQYGKRRWTVQGLGITAYSCEGLRAGLKARHGTELSRRSVARYRRDLWVDRSGER